MIAKNALVYPKVQLSKNVKIGDFCIIGVPVNRKKTIIGDNATIRSHTIIYSGNKIGKDFQTGHHTVVRENNIIDSNVSIGSFTEISHNVKIGKGARVHSQAFVSEYSCLAEEAWIGPQAMLVNAKYPKHPKAKQNLKGPRILKNAKIGANATILNGVRIGSNSLVGAGSVVTKNIPSNVIVAGNPAKVLRKIDY